MSQNMASVRYGGEGYIAPRAILRAGPVTAELLDNGALRYIKAGGREILRSLHMAFRDRNWVTIPYRIVSWQADLQPDSFSVAFTAIHRHEEIDFQWTGNIRGYRDGAIVYDMDGEARADFYRNRIGFCLLHPLEAAGTAVEVDTPEGTLSGAFPELIAPHDPFRDVTAMRYRVGPDTDAEIRFEGERFQTEDQRNWTDASFKTFCTPLRLPYPVQVSKGERIRQSVALHIRIQTPHTAADTLAASELKPLTLVVQPHPVSRMPRIGTEFTALDRPLSETELECLRPLHLSQLRVTLDLGSTGWKRLLLDAATAATALNCELEAEIITDGEENRIESLLSAIQAERIRVARLSVYPASAEAGFEPVSTRCELTGASYRACRFVTHPQLLSTLRKQAAPYMPDVKIGGGALANFAEFNRAVLPFPDMDFVEYPLHPQTHASDLDSIIETLDTQPLTVATAQAAAGRLPVRISAVTFKAKANVYASSRDEVNASRQAAHRADARLHSLFGSGWTLGSIRKLAEAGAEAVNFYETTGPPGILSEHGEGRFPVYWLLAAVGEYAGADVLAVRLSDSKKFQALALRKGNGVRVLIANLTDAVQQIRLEVPLKGKAAVRMMDERDSCLQSAAAFENGSNPDSLTLLPFATACIDGFM